jgi:hypothetical protein
VPDLLLFPLLALAWSPLLVVLHELGHAFAAMALSSGDVEIDMHGAGFLGGRATYEPNRLRRPRDEALIAAAGPAVTLVLATVLWLAWAQSGADSLGTLLGVGALSATIQLFTSLLPVRYGAGLGGPADSDGRAIWRILRGTPPGGIERELRRPGEPERAARPVFVVLLVIAAVLAVLADPWLLAALAVLFGIATLMQRKT